MQALVGFRLSGPPVRRNPTPAAKKSNLSIEFPPLSVGTYYGVSRDGEAGRTSELYLGSRNLPTHSYTYIGDPCKFWWDSDAPGSRFGETLTFSSTPIDVRRKGVGQWIFCLVVLG